MAAMTRELKGEFVLLGVFATFVVAFLLDIRDLPMEGKFLSYLAGAAALALAALCAIHAVVAERRKAGTASGATEEGESETVEQRKLGRKRFAFTAGMSVFLFAAIWLVGFYLGSGLMLLIWFVCLKRATVGALAVTVALPLLLYVSFEILFDMGLPKGELVKLLAG